jgi:acyl carrier protein
MPSPVNAPEDANKKEEFGGEISDDEAQEIRTVGDAVRYLEGREA